MILKETIMMFEVSDDIDDVKEGRMLRCLHNDMYNLFKRIDSEIDALPPKKIITIASSGDLKDIYNYVKRMIISNHKELIEWLYKLPYFYELENQILVHAGVDGNHENFPLMYTYPENKWNGGFVHEIREDILHLQRGYVFNIKGIKFFAFGGAYSIDKYSRIENESWFEEELPNEEEYERAWKELRKNNYVVDYIITHTAPYEVAIDMNKDMYEDEEELHRFFQEIACNVSFKKWYFGHFHEDEEINDSYVCVYDEVHVIE